MPTFHPAPQDLHPSQDPVGMDFESWWRKYGQYSRAGGGDYEKTFAYNAWNFAIQSMAAATKGEGLEVSPASGISGDEGQLVVPLLHCPFCGPGRSQVDLWWDDQCSRYRVGCGGCGCSTGTHSRDKTPTPVMLGWNTRGS